MERLAFSKLCVPTLKDLPIAKKNALSIELFLALIFSIGVENF